MQVCQRTLLSLAFWHQSIHPPLDLRAIHITTFISAALEPPDIAKLMTEPFTALLVLLVKGLLPGLSRRTSSPITLFQFEDRRMSETEKRELSHLKNNCGLRLGHFF